MHVKWISSLPNLPGQKIIEGIPLKKLPGLGFVCTKNDEVCNDIMRPKKASMAIYASKTRQKGPKTAGLDQKQPFYCVSKLHLLCGDKCWNCWKFWWDFVRVRRTKLSVSAPKLLRKSFSRSKRSLFCACNWIFFVWATKNWKYAHKTKIYLKDMH